MEKVSAPRAKRKTAGELSENDKGTFLFSYDEKHLATKHPKPVSLTRDSNGIIHVTAQSIPDLFYGWGLAHGTDRAMHLSIWRILMEGRASELLVANEEMLTIDTFFRRLDLYREVEREIERLTPDHKRNIERYCDGFNDATKSSWPWELKLLRRPRLLYRPRDVVALSRMLAFVGLAQTQGQLERFFCQCVQAGVDMGRLREMFPIGNVEVDMDLIKSISLGEELIPSALFKNFSVPCATASNNWVIAGAKTASGKPMLADDPHLEVGTIPALWYEVVLELSGQTICGAGMPGLPAMMIGRNAKVSWGLTYSFLDGVDSWVEECRDGNYLRIVEGKERWLPFVKRTEVIKRKGKPSVTVEFFENDHGNLDGNPHVAGRYLCTKWASANSGATSLQATMRNLASESAEQTLAHLGEIESTWNWVSADIFGNIGYQMSGLLPRRREGTNGFLPLPGWLAENDWRGFCHPSELPRAYNPPQGYFVTANHNLSRWGKVQAQNATMADHRARRIESLIESRNDWDVESCRLMQLDTLSLQAKEFMALLRPLLPKGDHFESLRNWDLRYDVESTGPTLFEAFYLALVKDIFGKTLGKDVIDFLVDKTSVHAIYFGIFDAILLNPESQWFGAEGQKSCFVRVVKEALNFVPQPWGKARPITMKHMLFGEKLPRWLGFSLGPLALPGGRATIRQTQIFHDGDRIITTGPSIRFVTDLGEARVHSRLAGGPSDRRFSRWYQSEVDAWMEGSLKSTEISCPTP